MAPYELLPTSLPLKEMHIEDSKRDHCLGRTKCSWAPFQKSMTITFLLQLHKETGRAAVLTTPQALNVCIMQYVCYGIEIA